MEIAKLGNLFKVETPLLLRNSLKSMR